MPANPPADPPAAPPLGALLETALYAPDLEAAARFYGGLLGLEPVGEAAGRHLFYRCGPGVLLVFNPEATARPAEPGARLAVPVHGATGPGHLAFAVADRDLPAWAARLQGAGVAVEAEVDWPGGGRSFYVRDPAGNSIEFADPILWEPRGR